MKKSHFTLSVGLASVLAAVALAGSGSAQARIPVIDPLVGAGLDAVLRAAGASHLPFASSYRPADDPALEARVDAAVALVHAHAGESLRYGSTAISLVQGTPGEPNAFCTGPRIFVSVGLARSLDDRQLTAVIAHEMAHAERGHLTQRMGFPLAMALVQLGRVAASDARAILRGGDADSFMKELWREGHWQMMMGMMESATLGQEMQADCIAYRWLSRMRDEGLPNRPEDIASAAMKLLGVERVAELGDDDFMGPRLRDLVSGSYVSSSCD